MTPRPLRKLLGAARRRWRAWRDGSPPVPVFFKLELSRACNLRCLHCGVPDDPPAPEGLPLERWLALVEEISAWAGPCHLTVVSGEPLLADGFFPVVEKAAREGLAVTVVSNGTLIGAPEARRLSEAGVRTLILSLDGARPETHDLGRGVPGTHARVLAALERVCAAGLAPRTQLQAIIAAHNLAELPDLVRLAEERRLAGIRFQALQPRGEGWRRFWPEDPGEVSRAIDALLELQAGGSPVLNPAAQLEALRTYYRDPGAEPAAVACRCAATLYIARGGAVHLCRAMDPVGDVRSASLRGIWGSPPVRERLAAVRSCRRPCILMNCHYPASGALW
ncbi:MAG: hypothetical protein A3J82_03505 [Elusimicrobia bacterium RIFOXYA2_FULL_69_6]|nr:MAG: hypothetical protein A3J82_03505 [Elusimicrobia bacterium RIFOXYA2_FULL_69_6]